MERVALIALAMLLAAGCVPRDYDKSALSGRLASESKIRPDDLLLDIPTEYALVTSRKVYDPMSFRCYHKAPFVAGVLVVARRDLVLYRFGDDGTTLVKEIHASLREIDSFAVATWGMFKHIHQLQVQGQWGTVAFAFGRSGALPQVRETLIEIGVKEGTPIGRVVVPVGWYNPEASC